MSEGTRFRWREIFVLILIGCSPFLFGASQLYAMGKSENCTDCLRILNRYEGHQYLAQIIKSERPYNTREVKETAFSLFMELWKRRDGALGFSLSDFFLDMLYEEPELFFSQMKREPTEYDAWLNELGPLSFVWRGDPPSPLEGKRQDLITFLRGISDLGEELDPLRIKLLKTLKEIEPRTVD